MSSERIPITPKGYQRLLEELTHLKSIERPAVIVAIAEARAHGDLSENAEYSAAREKQGFIEAKIADLESRIARAEVIDVKELTGSQIKFGATVTLLNEENDSEVEYQIVGEYEADLNSGLISISSPLAKALLGKSVGDQIEVATPKGIKYYDVITITYE
ncbi:MAG: transcription elongation factor GreA [Candidatus Midichloria mitochondrii]|nr:transcription elongation factor GreA [Candidatus Midichloria mitochondrii]MDJ1288033.1 transcription elongation factor GreA [Candidatus Midichloria mitochondrii]MDJ1298923.1 transcription elongation factor GreA [Candidatus Midichloria mitochondrii]MDJ1313086.1 transcription elongation factor GreA [Candidatus Midichloria mitochondrii]MDJ1583633.1 transcription elongation factor GreA [Candidatus Midichloria mitochondrii]